MCLVQKALVQHLSGQALRAELWVLACGLQGATKPGEHQALA